MELPCYKPLEPPDSRGIGAVIRVSLYREIGEPLSWPLGLAAIIFALAGPRRLLDTGFYTSPYLAAIIIAFIAHEMAHREVSRRYGMKSEFAAYVPGLLLTMISGLLPIVILAPGYVKTLVYKRVPDYKRAIVASVAAGPATNIALAIASLALSPILVGGSWMQRLALTSAWVNSWIAFFNLLPFPPLDGSKIMAHARELWLAMFSISLVLVVLA